MQSSPADSEKAGDILWVTPMEHVGAYVELELEASAPFGHFVYGDRETTRRIHTRLLEASVGEFAPPFGSLAIDSKGSAVGMIAGPLSSSELARARFRAAAKLHKDPDFASDPGNRARASLSRAAFLAVEPGDGYLSRIAVSPASRGRGIGRVLLDRFVAKCRECGARRAVLEVADEHQAAQKLYESSGFVPIGNGVAQDPSTGRELRYRHMGLELA
jgi:ribosomal protein S18 acetylase RimI-like enzyme